MSTRNFTFFSLSRDFRASLNMPAGKAADKTGRFLAVQTAARTKTRKIWQSDQLNCQIFRVFVRDPDFATCHKFRLVKQKLFILSGIDPALLVRLNNFNP